MSWLHLNYKSRRAAEQPHAVLRQIRVAVSLVLYFQSPACLISSASCVGALEVIKYEFYQCETVDLEERISW